MVARQGFCSATAPLNMLQKRFARKINWPARVAMTAQPRPHGDGAPADPVPGAPLDPALAAIESVSAVTIFPETSAAEFLKLAEPDVYVKGGDYNLDTMNQEERRNVEACGGQIHFLQFVEGKSTTNLINRLAAGS